MLVDRFGKPLDLRPKGSDGDQHVLNVIKTVADYRTKCCNARATVRVVEGGGICVLCTRCNRFIGLVGPPGYVGLFTAVPGMISNAMEELGFEGKMDVKDFTTEFEVEYRQTLVKTAKALIKKYLKRKFKGGDKVGN